MTSIPELREVFSYEPDSGLITWKTAPEFVRHINGREGAVAGNRRADGYVRITYREKSYLAHRLAWALVHGEFPIRMLDHVNRDKSDNRISNLRLCNTVQNGGNRALTGRGSSRFKGVSIDKRSGRWRVCCGDAHVGIFGTEAEAARAYDAAALKRFGEFAVLNFAAEG